MQVQPAALSRLLAALLALLTLSACNKTPAPSVVAAQPAAPSVSGLRVVSAQLFGALEAPSLPSTATATVASTLHPKIALTG